MIRTGPSFLLSVLALAVALGCAKGEDADDPAAGGSGAGAGAGSGGSAGSSGASGAAAGGNAGSAGGSGMGGSLPDASADATDDAANDAAPDATTVGGCQCDSPGCGQCPTVAMIAVTGFRVDSIEVTNGQYDAFLNTLPDASQQLPSCASNADFTPSAGWPGDANLPVTAVDWCDAYAYCHWARKRLCGAVGGGPQDFASFADATTDQWYRACTGAGARSYPYGNTYESGTCNGSDFGSGAKIPAGEAACQGAYPGLFDMSGNVWEWVDACDGDAAGAMCRIRGGSYANGGTSLRCDTDSTAARSETHPTVGFRCCVD